MDPIGKIDAIELQNADIIATSRLRSSSHISNADLKTSLYSYLSVATFSIVGCIIRVGVDYGLSSNTYMQIESPNSIIFQSFFANMIGSFILGLLTASTLKNMSGMLPIYTGLSTGLCGSITTFSKFNQQVSEMIVGQAITIGNPYFTAFAAIILGIAAPICSFIFGHDLSLEIRKVVCVTDGTDFSRQRRSIKVSKSIIYISIPFFIISWITLSVLAIVYSHHQNIIYTCLCGVLAPFGATLRFILSKLNVNTRPCLKYGFLKRMPIGTFLANFIGATVMAFLNVILVWTNMWCPWKAFFRALQSGFCACLTTVSTFVSEITSLRSKEGIFVSHCYAFLTIALCQFVSGVINGLSLAVYVSETRTYNSTSCS
ncbi:uncharacterized protein LOC120336803 [Styela clava]